MKKIIISLLIFLALPVFAEENKLQFFLSKDIKKDCSITKELWGCYFSGSKKIYLSVELKDDMDLFKYVFWHEVGHYYLDGEDLSLFNGDEELAAHLFSNWINELNYCAYGSCGEPNFKQKRLFRKLIK